jgi:hypothetical protein
MQNFIKKSQFFDKNRVHKKSKKIGSGTPPQNRPVKSDDFWGFEKVTPQPGEIFSKMRESAIFRGFTQEP